MSADYREEAERLQRIIMRCPGCFRKYLENPCLPPEPIRKEIFEHHRDPSTPTRS